jgi:hypothetical protein
MKIQKKRNTPVLLATAFATLALILSVAWAATYYVSGVIGNDGGIIVINDNARIRIAEGALSAYLAEKGVDSVEITVEATELYDANGNFNGAMFVFGPSGAYFDPPLRLQFRGEYIGKEMLLFDENGEALEYNIIRDGKLVSFLIPHFSSYSYDHYDY